MSECWSLYYTENESLNVRGEDQAHPCETSLKMISNQKSVMVPELDLRAAQKLLVEHAVPDNLVVMRLSRRAKKLIFKSSIKKGVEIIIPYGANSSWVTKMTQERIPWIKNAQQNIKERRGQLNPKEINLIALGETWSTKYSRVGEIPKGIVDDEPHTLTVNVDPKDIFSVARNLQSWFHQKAKDSLVPWLASLAEDRTLRFERTYIKNQVSLWGSCSKKRNINLNRNLLFLPRHLVEYVLHHELTHLQHFNHSERFWSSFSHVLPNCFELRRELKSLNPENIPLWACSRLDRD